MCGPKEADHAPSFWRPRWAPGNSCGLAKRGSASSLKAVPTGTQHQEGPWQVRLGREAAQKPL